mgnify:CR=1 FL=1
MGYVATNRTKATILTGRGKMGRRRARALDPNETTQHLTVVTTQVSWQSQNYCSVSSKRKCCLIFNILMQCLFRVSSTTCLLIVLCLYLWTLEDL